MLKAIALLITSLTLLPASAQTEKQCLYTAIIHEAGAEPIEGQRAVAQVILNRTKKWKKNICDVISQPGQFVWYGVKPMLQFGTAELKKLRNIMMSEDVLNNEKFLYFYDRVLNPRWARKMECVDIYNHRFCKVEEKQ